MAWIDTVTEGEAEGLLAKHYKAAQGRAGSVAGIIKLHSNHVPTLRASMNLYMATTTMEDNPLPRWTRELIATVVSRTNDCFYWTLSHGESLRGEGKSSSFVEAVIADYRTAPLDPPMMALLDWCVRLTRAPATLTEADVAALREHGWTDEDISAAGFVCSYFNFINRVADGLGVDLEPWMHEQPPLDPCPW